MLKYCRLRFTLTAVAAVLVLSACRGHGMSSPEGVATKYMQALFEGDTEACAELFNFSDDPNHRHLQEQMISGYAQKFYNDCKDKGYCLKKMKADAVGDPDLVSNGGTITVKFDTSMTNGEMPPAYSLSATLIKLGNTWKINPVEPESSTADSEEEEFADSGQPENYPPGAVVPGSVPPGTVIPGRVFPGVVPGDAKVVPGVKSGEDNPREQATIIRHGNQ